MKRMIRSVHSTLGMATILSAFAVTLVVTTPTAFNSRASGGARQGTLPQCSLAYTEIHFPGAQISGAFGINNSNQIVGVYYDSKGNFHGFLYDQGVYTPINYPDPTVTNTSALAINDGGVIVGGYIGSEGRSVGYFRTPNGNFGEMRYPNAIVTNLHGISNNPNFTGGFSTDGVYYHGYVNNNQLDYPTAVWTQAYGTNDAGRIVGKYRLALGGALHGFLFRGNYTEIKVPGAITTEALEIDNLDRIVGDFTDDLGLHGFRLIGTSFCQIDATFPGFIASQTDANGINDHGRIVGTYLNSQGQVRGFVTQ